MKLIDLQKNDIFKITDLDEVCDHVKGRLLALGADKKSIAQVLHKGFFGPIEIEINNSKIAIGRKMAKKIGVKKLSCPLLDK
ncbi:MAG: ferrous iron transport protein A [Epsilonproteobacteria bacterium]|nr:ferrous iron transport protein A [Campylobacterota bacterium]